MTVFLPVWGNKDVSLSNKEPLFAYVISQCCLALFAGGFSEGYVWHNFFSPGLTEYLDLFFFRHLLAVLLAVCLVRYWRKWEWCFFFLHLSINMKSGDWLFHFSIRYQNVGGRCMRVGGVQIWIQKLTHSQKST